MPDDIVRTVIEAVDNASDTLGKIGAGYDKLGDEVDKTTKRTEQSAAEVERSFSSMAQSLNRGTDTSAAQASISSLDDMLRRGVISADTYGAAIGQVGIDSGLTSRGSVEAADALMALNKQLADGKITSDQYADGVKKIGAELEKKPQGLGLSVIELNQALELGEKAIEAFKKTWEFAKEGAEINRIKEQFIASAQEMGTNAEILGEKMQKAVRGTVDDEELARAATRLMTQDIVASSDDIVRGLEVARAASIRFGGTTIERFDTMIQSADMLSTRGFKRMGIIVGDTKDIFENYAKTLGKTGDTLTDAEKKTGLFLAALDKGEVLVKKVGASADDQLTKIQRLETGFKDFGDTIKSAAAGVLVDFTDDMTVFAKIEDATIPITERLAIAHQVNARANGEWTGKLGPFIDALQRQKDAEERLAGITAVSTQQNYQHSDSLTAVWIESQRVTETLASQANGMAQLEEDARNAAYAERTMAEEQRKNAEAQRLLQAGLGGAVGKATEQLAASQEDLGDKIEKAREKLEKLTGAQGKAIPPAKDLVTYQHQLANAQFDAETSAAKLADAQAKLSASTDPDKIRQLQGAVFDAQVAYDRASGSIANSEKALRSHSGGVVDNSKAIQDAQGAYDALIAKQDAAAAAAHRSTQEFIFQQAAQGLDAGAALELARSMGLIDESTYATTKALEKLRTQYDTNADNAISATEAAKGYTSSVELTAKAIANLQDAHIKITVDSIQAEIAKMTAVTPPKILVDAKLNVTDNTEAVQANVELLEHNARRLAEEHVLNVKADTEAAQGHIGLTEKMAERVADKTYNIKFTAEQAKDAADHIGFVEKLAQRTATTYQVNVKDNAQEAAERMALVEKNAKHMAATYDLKIKDNAKDAQDHVAALKQAADRTAGTYNVSIVDDAKESEDRIVRVGNAIDRLPRDVFVRFHFNVPSLPSLPSTTEETAPVAGHAQYGANFIVPPNPFGGIGDYYPVRAAPGERVIVQTPQQQKQGIGGNTVIYNTNIYNPMAAAMFLDQQRRERIARSEARMGV